MKKHLVIVGGGHAHLTVLKNLETFIKQGHRATVVSSNDFHYYSGMGPGMLSGIYKPEMIRFNVKKMVEDRGGVFIEDKVVKADPEKKRIFMKKGNELEYDVISFNTGSAVPFEYPEAFRNEFVFSVKPIENLLTARKKIIEALKKKPLKIWVAGGGAAGVEVSSALRRLVKEEGGKAEISIIAGKQLLPGFNTKVRERVMEKFKNLQIKVMEGVRLKNIHEKKIELSNASEFDADFIFPAVGTAPSPMFKNSGITAGDDRGMLVDEYLRSVSYPDIFGGGDCITFSPRPLPRIGIYAVRENPVLYNNLQVRLKNGSDYQKFLPQKYFMLILNMGDGTGIFFRKSLIWSGRPAFILKDYIDRKFMKTFQVSGELRHDESVNC